MPSFEPDPFDKLYPREEEGTAALGVLEHPSTRPTGTERRREGAAARRQRLHQQQTREGMLLVAEPHAPLEAEQPEAEAASAKTPLKLADVEKQMQEIKRLFIEGRSREGAELKEAIVRQSVEQHAFPKALGELLIQSKRWVVLDELEQGGMATVYHAYDLNLGRPVALKMLLPRDRQAISEDSMKFFEQEGRLWAKLGFDPSIVKLYDAGICKEGGFIAMQEIEGQSVKQEMQEGGRHLQAAELIKMGLDIVRGLRLMHKEGIVHCDLKPSNILHAKTGPYVIADFGISLSLDQEEPKPAWWLLGGKKSRPFAQRTNDLDSRTTAGSRRYAAPEQKVENGKITTATDSWGLGITLYVAAARKTPFQSFAIEGTMPDYAVDLKKMRPDLPPAFTDLVMRTLNEDPAQRPGLEEIAHELSMLAVEVQSMPPAELPLPPRQHDEAFAKAETAPPKWHEPEPAAPAQKYERDPLEDTATSMDMKLQEDDYDDVMDALERAGEEAAGPDFVRPVQSTEKESPRLARATRVLKDWISRTNDN